MACPKNCPFCYANKKETAVIDDSNCHCMKCSTNSDIQKEFGVANDDKLRISIYREAWQDAEKETIKLREELAYQTKFRELYEKSNKERGIENDRLREENDWLVRLQEENKKLREENERLNTHKARYQQEITDIEADYEKLFKTLQGLRNTLQRCSDDIYSAIMVD